jgi:hypothetical protein
MARGRLRDLPYNRLISFFIHVLRNLIYLLLNNSRRSSVQRLNFITVRCLMDSLKPRSLLQ